MPGVTGDHYFTAEPAVPARPREVEFTVAGRAYTLASAGGVFSADRLDPGTAVLLRKAELPAPEVAGPLLDLGCGFGPITCVLADRAPRAAVWAVDVNKRARELTAANAARLGAADRVRVAAPDEVPDGLTFAQLWSNPPIHVGKEGLHELLRRWLPRLAPDGVAWLVIARHLGGDSLHRWLVEQGWQVERHASQKGFRVLRVTR
ncbi:16S rRNA m(2)G 1207 methyltransferase [Micromonospora olivasterospora]|uniref:16S rRNA m(2)G 1207 methyltransferase n=1 Tax=Micromonospora olivasterospora TaxID=1880 RepID=A0A562I7D9_MICOL|nr:16S rRNA m(2)G 1207 methyltransferase [Micromonospora olivasterospora]